MYTCIKVSTKCINSQQLSSISSLEKKCRDRFYSKAKTLYFEVTDDSLIKLVFHPLSSETRKVRKGFDSAGNGRKNPLSTDPNTSHGCPPVTRMHTPPNGITKEDVTERGFLRPHHSPPIKYSLANSSGVPSFRLNPPRSPTLRSSELICAKQPNIRKVC